MIFYNLYLTTTTRVSLLDQEQDDAPIGRRTIYPKITTTDFDIYELAKSMKLLPLITLLLSTAPVQAFETLEVR